MKPIMSFWSKPYTMGLHNKWINENAFKLSWLISVNKVSEFYEKPILYTDQKGKELLCDDFGLQFSDVIVCLDESISDIDPRFSSISRYYAITQQNEPFFHIDYDFFFWSKMPEEIEKNDLIFESQYVFDNSRTDNFNKFQSPLHRPHELVSYLDVDWWWMHAMQNGLFRAYNCSLIGGTDLTFLHEMAEKILSYSRAKTPQQWEHIDNKIKNSYPEDALLMNYGSIASYTISEYIPFVMCLRDNKHPLFLMNEFGMKRSSFSHVSYAKSLNEEVYGMLLKRYINDYDEENKELPKTSIVVIPDGSNVYDCVLRCVVPRKMKPDEIVVLDNGIDAMEKDLLEKLEEVKIVHIPPNMHKYEFMSYAYQEASNDIIMFVYSSIRVPRLYIEKTLSAHLQYPNAAFCAITNDLCDEEGNSVFIYGSSFDGKSFAKPHLNYSHKHPRNISETNCLYGDFYAMPRHIAKTVLDKVQNSIENISKDIKENGFELRCIENILVSNNNMKTVQT